MLSEPREVEVEQEKYIQRNLGKFKRSDAALACGATKTTYGLPLTPPLSFKICKQTCHSLLLYKNYFANFSSGNSKILQHKAGKKILFNGCFFLKNRKISIRLLL